MSSTLIKWDRNVRKIAGSVYSALPPVYCKTYNVHPGDVIGFDLNADGTLTLRFRKPEVK